MGYTSSEDLEVWKRSARLAVKIEDALGDCRDYGLKDQDDPTAAVSIASHIAEGAASASFLVAVTHERVSLGIPPALRAPREAERELR